MSQRRQRRRSAILLCAAGLLLAMAAACGGGDDDGGGSPTASPAKEGPGAITVSSSAIEGQDGKMLLIQAFPETGAPLARVCASIDSDSFTLSGAVMTGVPSGNDPCGGSTADTVFPEGAYTVKAGIYAPPAQTASKEFSVQVTVKGDTTVELDGAALSD